MSRVRHAAVAGMFYPDDARDLDGVVRVMLCEAQSRIASGPPVKAIVVPHAGYVYSGAVAASAYARIASLGEHIRRVVLLGPSHRVPISGLMVPSAEAFETPLGLVPVDRAGVATALECAYVTESNVGHVHEHSLEVQLPFLQVLLPNFAVVPIVVGDASASTVADVLERLWGGPETLLVISSDLSHYLDYDGARELDSVTCAAIEHLDSSHIGYDQACGQIPLSGMLMLAKRKGLSVSTLDLRNSGDTAGGRGRVVGYGAWAFSESQADPSNNVIDCNQQSAQMRSTLDRHGATLLHVAAASIENGLRSGRPLSCAASDYPDDLKSDRATFVSLYADKQLRGCVGSARASRPLVVDVAENAFNAAFRDSRFDRLTFPERQQLSLSISLLSPLQPIDFRDEDDLLRQLNPGRDGVVIESEGRRALFLPQVWAALPQAQEFLAQLKKKAGMTRDRSRKDLRAWRFITESVSSKALPELPLWS